MKIFWAAVTAVMAAAMCACGHDPKPEPKPLEPVHRTVLVYMIGTNDLGKDYGNNFDAADLREMCAAAKAGGLNGGRLLVYHADYTGDPLMKEVTAAGIDTLKTYTDDNLSVSSARMQQVISDMKALAPADQYGIILWGHATGWLQDGLDDPIDTGVAYSYGYDNVKENWMNITTLARTLEGQGLEFVYFDCCLMASIEVLYEMRHVSPLMVASATEVPGPGMPYDLTVPYFFTNGNADLEGVARTYFTYYKENPAMTGGGCPVTTAVITTEHIDELAAATRAIYAQSAVTCPDGYKGQLYYINENYYDFGHYVAALAGEGNPLLDQWQQAMDKVVGYKAASDYIWDIRPITYYSGLSTFIIRKESDNYKSNYNTLSWYDDVVKALPLAF